MTAALGRFNRRTFSSLRYRNYRLFFSGQLVSQTGSWMQRIALGWYVLQLTHNDAFAVGVMAFAQFLPFTIFGLFAGVFTDRLDARRLVIATQVAQTVSAVALTWIAYPKAGQLGTDLNRDSVAEILSAEGVRPVRQIAVDDVWSALRLRPGSL